MPAPSTQEAHNATMLKVFAILSLAALCLGSPLGAHSEEDKLSPPIVGGESVDIKDFPYQLAFRSGPGFCGASIISKNWVLTAAHCTTGTSVSQMSLRAGSSNRNSGGSVHNVIKKVEHPNYKASGNDWDYSLLQVDPPFVFGSGVAAVPLAAAGQTYPAGTNAVVSGWGTTKEDGSQPTNLQAVTVPTVSTATCQASYGSTISPRMVCAGLAKGGKDSCQGDSGGPLVIGGKQAGVVSFGNGCARANYPGVYSYVPAVREWIQTNTGV